MVCCDVFCSGFVVIVIWLSQTACETLYLPVFFEFIIVFACLFAGRINWLYGANTRFERGGIRAGKIKKETARKGGAVLKKISVTFLVTLFGRVIG